MKLKKKLHNNKVLPLETNFLELFFRYALIPLITALATLGWHMFKKQDTRLDNLEKRTSDTEKAIIEIKTSFKYVAEDIKEIKTMVGNLSEHK